MDHIRLVVQECNQQLLTDRNTLRHKHHHRHKKYHACFYHFSHIVHAPCCTLVIPSNVNYTVFFSRFFMEQEVKPVIQEVVAVDNKDKSARIPVLLRLDNPKHRLVYNILESTALWLCTFVTCF